MSIIRNGVDNETIKTKEDKFRRTNIYNLILI